MACFGGTEDGWFKKKFPEIWTLTRHPWELTLREFIEQVDRNYGIEIQFVDAAVTGGRFLSTTDRRFPAPMFDLDEVMPIPLLAFLCRFYRIPAEDFGLSPVEKEDA